mgnify:CR=1 FL=1
MASVHKRDGSKYWHGKFTLPDGRRMFRSTKQTDKTKALQVTLGWEKATRMKVGSDQAHKVMADIVKTISGDDFEQVSLYAFCDKWLTRRKLEVAPRSYEKYAQVVRELKAAIPESVAMAHVTTRRLVDVRDDFASRISLSTANDYAKIIRMIFNDAFLTGAISENPAQRIKPLNASREKKERVQRRPFRIDEVEAILDTMEPEEEWYGMVLLGVYSGQRLRDVASAQREHIIDGVWVFKSRKTNLPMRVVLAIPVIKWLKKHAPKTGPLFPKNSEAKQSSILSNRFYRIMSDAGLVPRRSHAKKADGKGRAAERTLSELGFHCFRHTTQTWLMESGASRELAMAHVGHEDEKTSRGYTHIGVDTLKGVVTKMPAIRMTKMK